jgi:leader peptidase (prepilin peptidase)/N-methyltransferase
MMLIAALLSASLIDAELFIIPLGIPWFIVPFALIEHAVFDRPGWPGALTPSIPSAALAVGAAIGLFISIFLRSNNILKGSFVEGGPMLEVEKAKLEKAGESVDDAPQYTPKQTRAEMRKEMKFLFPPLALGMISLAMAWRLPIVAHFWAHLLLHQWVGGLLGSILGLLVGGFVVWLTRILGSIGFGREAMGMGDVDLMAAVGAVLGPGSATVAFFLAPFFGILLVIYMLLTGKKRELPFGPYLSLATAFVMLFYCPIADYLSPGITSIGEMLSRLWGAG